MNTVATNYFQILATELSGAKSLPTQTADFVPTDYVLVLHGINAFLVPDATDGDIQVQVTDTSGNVIVSVGKYFVASQSDTLAVNFNGIPCFRAKAGALPNSFVDDQGTLTTGTAVVIVAGAQPVDGYVTLYYSWQPKATLRN